MNNQLKYKGTPLGCKPYNYLTEELAGLLGGWHIVDDMIEYNLVNLWSDIAYKSVIKAIESQLGVSEKDLLSKKRHGEIKRARSIASYILNTYTFMGVKVIAKKLNIDHSTLLYHCNIAGDPMLKKFNPLLHTEFSITLSAFIQITGAYTTSALAIKTRMIAKIKEMQAIVDTMDDGTKYSFLSIVENLKTNSAVLQSNINIFDPVNID